MYQIKDNILNCNGQEVEFKTPIMKAIELHGVIAVRLKIVDITDDNNVYGAKDGRIIWRIQEQAAFNPLVNLPLLPKFHAYGNIDIYSEDPKLIIATDGSGFRFLVDPLSGKIVGEESWDR